MALMVTGACLAYGTGGRPSVTDPRFTTAPERVPEWVRRLPGAPRLSARDAHPEALAWGLGSVLGACLLAALGVLWVARAEELLTVTTEGVEVLRSGRREVASWDAIERVTWDAASRGVVLRGRDGVSRPLRWAAKDEEGRRLAQELEDVRRKASFGLLPEQRRQNT